MTRKPIQFDDGQRKQSGVRVRMNEDLVRVLQRIAEGTLVTAEIDKIEKPVFKAGKHAGESKKGWAASCAKRLSLLNQPLVERLGPGVYQVTPRGLEYLEARASRLAREAAAPEQKAPEARVADARRAINTDRKARRRRIFNEHETELPTSVDRHSQVEIAARHDDRGTPERSAHGEVRETKITELNRIGEEQTIGRAAKAADTLDIMLRARTIESEWYAAGRRFQKEFRLAHLDPAKAQNLYRVPGGDGPDITEIIDEKRRAINKALDVLGGRTSPLGRIAWHVLGEQHQISEWAAEQKREGGPSMNVTRAGGLLCATLALLALHYERSAPPKRRGAAPAAPTPAEPPAAAAAAPPTPATAGKKSQPWSAGWPP